MLVAQGWLRLKIFFKIKLPEHTKSVNASLRGGRGSGDGMMEYWNAGRIEFTLFHYSILRFFHSPVIIFNSQLINQQS